MLSAGTGHLRDSIYHSSCDFSEGDFVPVSRVNDFSRLSFFKYVRGLPFVCHLFSVK